MAVSAIMARTHSATGVSRLAKVFVRAIRARTSTNPQTTPPMCIAPRAYPTMAPAWSRLLKIRNAPGATTKLRNTSLPSHRLKARNSMVRKRLDMEALYKSVGEIDHGCSAPYPEVAACAVSVSCQIANSAQGIHGRTNSPRRDVTMVSLRWWATKDLNL